MEIKCIYSERGKELLIINKYKFSAVTTTTEGVRWRCCNKNKRCTAKAYTTREFKIINSDLIHNHDEDMNIERQALSNSVKRKAVEDKNEKPGKLIRMELQKNFSDKLTKEDINRVRRNVWKCRNTLVPKLPKSQEMTWRSNQIDRLIQEYEKEEILYNMKHPHYNNKRLRNIALQNIVREMCEIKPNVTIIEVLKKLHELRNAYDFEQRRIMDFEKSTTSDEENYNSSLWYYPKLEFLRKYIGTNESVTNSNRATSVSSSSETDSSVSKNEELILYSDCEGNTNDFDEYTKSHAFGPSTPVQISNSHSPIPIEMKGEWTENSIETVAINSDRNRSTTAETSTNMDEKETLDELFGRYISSALLGFKNEKNKIETKYKINQILYEASLKELEGTEKAHL